MQELMRNFYNVRNFEFAWFSSKGVSEQASSFSSLYKYDKDSNFSRSLENRFDNLAMDTLALVANDSNVVKTELQLTQHFIQYITGNNKDENALYDLIPTKKTKLLDLVSTTLSSNKPPVVLTDNVSYNQLLKQLQKYYSIYKKGGWDTIPADIKLYKKGTTTPAIALLKKRLAVTGEYASTDTTSSFNNELDSAVKIFQLTHGHKPNGVLSKDLITEMNVPVLKRMEQLLVNMERAKWMPVASKGKLVLVNIPEFELHAWQNDQKAFDMNVVVGSEANGTIMFSGNISEVVFSPYWNIPASITRKDIVPHMKSNKDYLKEHNMQIVGQDNGLPVVRQLPGIKNALGRVKFLFPNSFNIYLHDTNEKGLFSTDKRSDSHGCIRLQDPVKMAQFILEDPAKWPVAKINEAMNSGKEKTVEVKKPVPVMITYYSAWVDDNNLLHFADDIYNHDASMASKMFTDPL